MRIRNLLLTILLVSLFGCATVQFDYAPPASGPTARVAVTSSAGEYLRNMPVLIHTDKCDYPSSKLAGLLYSAAVGVDYAKEIDLVVAANRMVSISVQAIFKDVVSSLLVLPGRGGAQILDATTNTTYCRPIVDFYAKEGVEYRVELIAAGEDCFYTVQSRESGFWIPVGDAATRDQCKLPFSRAPKAPVK